MNRFLKSGLMVWMSIVGSMTVTYVDADTDRAQDDPSPCIGKMTLRVDGLACPFCAYGLEKKVDLLGSYVAGSYVVRINQGEVDLEWKRTEPLDIAAIERAVRLAGYSLRGIRVRVVGKIVRKRARYFLDLRPSVHQYFSLYESSMIDKRESGERHAEEGKASALGYELRARLDRALSDDRTVQVSGTVHSHDGGRIPPAIAVESVSIIGSAKRGETTSDDDESK